MDRLQELVRLHRMGTGAREVARLLSMSPNTERAYREALDREGLLAGEVEALPELDVLKAAVARAMPAVPAPQNVSSIERYEPRIVELAKAGAGPKAIFDRLRLEERDFDGTFWAVRAVYRRWRKQRGVRAEDVAIPVETAAGDVAQVDFGYVGWLYDAASGRRRKAWVFVLVLAYSRLMFARVVFDQKIETWLRLHVEAFASLGGVPATIVPDNLKAAVIRAAFGVDGAASLNRSYRELARHYGFKVDPAPIYSPEKKPHLLPDESRAGDLVEPARQRRVGLDDVIAVARDEEAPLDVLDARLDLGRPLRDQMARPLTRDAHGYAAE